MVAPKSKTRIPVSCVERGRWHYSSPAFRSGGSSAHYALRKITSRSVLHSLAATGIPSSDQGAVWKAVHYLLDSMGSQSGSDALQQVYVDHEAALDRIVSKLEPLAGCNGAVFVIGGRIAGMDLFDRPATFAKLLPKLARAYGIDAVDRSPGDEPVETSKRRPWWPWKSRADKHAPGAALPDVKAWLCSASAAQSERFASAGLGDDIRIRSESLVGAGLVVDGEPVHVELFSEQTRRPGIS